MFTSFRALGVFSLLLTTSSLHAQVSWRQEVPGSLGCRTEALAVTDTYRNVVVLLENPYSVYFRATTASTWEWNGQAWQWRTAAGPGPRVGTNMVFAASTRRTILFGGSTSSGVLNDTWSWDGTSWTLLNPPQSPPGRYGHMMAYDSVRDRVVLLAGATDTWEFDGQTWYRTAATGPWQPGHMCFDAARGVTVLHQRTGVTWEYDGTSWVNRGQVDPVAFPLQSQLAFDPVRQRVAFWSSTRLREWDGTTWLDRPGSLPMRSLCSLAFDPVHAQLLLYGGRGFAEVHSIGETWTLAAGGWVRRALADAPTPRLGPGTAALPRSGMMMLHGGMGGDSNGVQMSLADTWLFDGRTFTPALTGAVLPPPRYRHALAAGVDDRVLLFGGDSYSVGLLDDTWEWSNGVWSQRLPTVRPSRRAGHAMAADLHRGKVLLFGGGAIQHFDTWEWDGNDWRELTGAGTPALRGAHAAWDPRSRSVMLVGSTGQQIGARLFEGGQWQALPSLPFVAPTEASVMGAVGDLARTRVVVRSSGGFFEWSGTAWINRTSQSPDAAGFSYQPSSGRSYAFAPDTAHVHNPVFMHSFGPDDPATVATVGTGCLGPLGVPELRFRHGARPYLGELLPFELTNVPVSALPVLAIGLANDNWLGIPLPVELAPFQMPGCFLRVRIDTLATMTRDQQTGRYGVVIPNAMSLAGLVFHCQGAVLQAPGGAVSAALTARIGTP